MTGVDPHDLPQHILIIVKNDQIYENASWN